MQELRDINLKGNPIGDFSPLGEIPKLRWLNLTNTGIKNFQWISDVNQLDSLIIEENGLTDNTDFSCLKKLKIESLDISKNYLRNANGLKSFPHLDSLTILNNPLESLGFISHMKKLRLVEIGFSTELDLSPLINHFTKHQIEVAQVTLCGDKSLLDAKQLKQLEKVVTVHFRNY